MNQSERYRLYRRLRARKEVEIYSALFEPLARHAAEAVIEDPSLAGQSIDIGDFEAGHVGAIRFTYPTLEQAREWLANNPNPERNP